MAVGESVELVGANKERVAVVGKRIETRVSLDNAVRQKVAANRSIGAVEGAEDRVFLNLENVNGLQQIGGDADHFQSQRIRWPIKGVS